MIRRLPIFPTSFPSCHPLAFLQIHWASYSSRIFPFDSHVGIRILVSPSSTTKTSKAINSKSPPRTWFPVTTFLGCPYSKGNQPLLPIPTWVLQLSIYRDLRLPIPFCWPPTLTFPKSFSTVSAAATSLYLLFLIYLKEPVFDSWLVFYGIPLGCYPFPENSGCSQYHWAVSLYCPGNGAELDPLVAEVP